MEADHRQQMKVYLVAGESVGRIMFAMAILSDIVDGNFARESRNQHIREVKEILGEAIKIITKRRY